MNQQKNYFEEDEKPIDWKAVIMEYLIYWPFILAFLIVSLIGAYILLRFQEPTYQVSSSVLIKEEGKNKGGGAMDQLAAMQDFGMLSMARNFDNELEIIQSRTLIKKVVVSHNLYINTKESRAFGYSIDLYESEPVKAWMSPEEAEKLPSTLKLNLQCLPGGAVNVEANYAERFSGKKVELEAHFDKLPAIYTTPVGTIMLSLPTDSTLWIGDEERNLKVSITNPTTTAIGIKKNLSGAPTSKQTSIIGLNYVDSDPTRAIHFINALVAQYNNDANNDKNQVAAKTAEFIDSRINIINRELGTTESKLAEYKKKAGLTNIEADAQLALQGNSEYEQKKSENSTQLRLIAFLKEYVHNPANQFEVIPANIGLKDINISTFIESYNQLIIERKRLLRTSNINNPAVQNMDIAIDATRKSVLTSVESAEKGLQITKMNLDAEAKKFETKISEAPRQEKELISIARQQEIKANLYLMLLQKREENAITLAATANNGRIIEEPIFDGQVGPKGAMIMMLAVILGLGIPVGCIFILNLLHFKIENHGDVEAITDATIVGDVPATKVNTKHAVVVRDNENGLMEEVYRSVRTNLQFMLEKNEKVILFTSTSPGEGKSFNAANLAMSFATMGKKTLIVGLDIRKPGLNKVFNISRREKGISQYLSNSNEENLIALCQQSSLSENLYILPGGTVPPNPTELVARKALDDAFEIFRKEFDYIIVDTAPVGLVTDTLLISRIADVSVYVCRADYTHKTDLQLVNELRKEQKMPKLCVLINGINMEKRRNGYYYGYGKYGSYGKYGYGKKYGYGYGYGYGDKK